MFTLDSIVLYVIDIHASQTFYADLFNCKPTPLSPTFVAINLADNIKITLKQTAQLTPASDVTGGGTELSVAVADQARFEEVYRVWDAQGVVFAQYPEAHCYGLNFVALDPDGHRIRVFIG
ncbi:VOC family protein [Vibrio ostreicida]|uniref:VOC family protein n=1 Tax=Vibrio ostreicida TaxID=526588 RepID=UPI003B5A0FF2